MRLLNTESLKLSGPYVPSTVPDYAILSHRWNNKEITFPDIRNSLISPIRSQTSTDKAIKKIQGVCELAKNNGYMWIWIDSCCIDKSSSAELQEAINSMWRYYAESNVCYVYLEDVADWKAGWGADFAASSWFTRGWTLQELIAPRHVEFYTENWAAVGTKLERFEEISEITSIDQEVLLGLQDAEKFSAAERLSWASHRNVTREEDEAYSLLGLFGISLALLYGEGREKAFVRLQEAIYNSTADHSIFLFRQSQYVKSQPLLADSPKYFCDKIHCESCSAQGTQRNLFNLRYKQIFASHRWRTQAHEQIMTTVTMSRNEVSTVLELLEYKEVAKNLHYVQRDTIRAGVTHVAILNYTLGGYQQGAFCLLLRHESADAFLRVQVLPAVLYDLGDLEPCLRKTKILVCAGEKNGDAKDVMSFVFSLGNGPFQVETWHINENPAVLSAEPRECSQFKVQTKLQGELCVTCRVLGFQNPQLSLVIQLRRMCGIWSISEVILQKGDNKNCELQSVFSSIVPTDRCKVQLLNEQPLEVALRRLSSSARGDLEDPNGLQRYQIFLR